MSGKINVGKTNLAILHGDDDVRDWDDEELRRGQRRDRRGGWAGKPPTVIPKAVHDELVHRQYDEAARLLWDSLVDAVRLLGEIVRDPTADPAVRLKAANLIVERVMGRAPVKVQIEVEPAWAVALRDVYTSLVEADSWETPTRPDIPIQPMH